VEEQVDDSVTLQKRLEDVELLLEEFERKNFLHKIVAREIDLDISRETLLSMSVMDLDGLAWDLAQYGLAIQKLMNKSSSRLNWSESNLKRVLEREANNYQGFTWQERQAEVLNHNVYAQKLHKLKEQSKMVFDRLYSLPQKIEFLSKIAKDISYSKKRYEKEEYHGD